MATKSLQALDHDLAKPENQIRFFEEDVLFTKFSDQLKDLDQWPLQPHQVEIFQINMGKMCNQVCAHCHVDAGPDRKEIMTWETMQQCLEAISKHPLCLCVPTEGRHPCVRNGHKPLFACRSGGADLAS